MNDEQWPHMHPATQDLVRRFSWALADKLAAAEQKYGYSNGWASPDWMDECRAHLMEHIAKGDPRDVAAYCAFLWHHGASTATPPKAEAAPFHEDVYDQCCEAIKPLVDRGLLPGSVVESLQILVEHFTRAEATQAAAEGAAKQFAMLSGTMEAETPLERLRFYCSLAMNAQDWIDAEPFFDAIAPSPAQSPEQP